MNNKNDTKKLIVAMARMLLINKDAKHDAYAVNEFIELHSKNFGLDANHVKNLLVRFMSIKKEI